MLHTLRGQIGDAAFFAIAGSARAATRHPGRARRSLPAAALSEC
jgi:hypothetical protein